VGNRKIVVASTEFSTGGLGSYLRTVAGGLGARGWEVHLLVTDHPGDLFFGIEGVSARHDLSGTPLSVHKVRRAADLLERIAPEFLLLNHAALLHYALSLLDTRVRPVAVIHSDDRRYYRTAALFQHRVFAWVAPSRRLAELFTPRLPTERRGRVCTIPHGVDMHARTPPEHRSLPGGNEVAARDGVRIIFVGFLGPSKGADQLPAIMRRVWPTCPAASLTIVGDGPLRAALTAEFAAGEIAGGWRFTGAVGRDEVARLLRESDVLLLPTKLEGFGLVIPEAMLSGCVPVVSRLAGITDEIVDAGSTGFLVDPADSAGFADIIIRLAQDTPRREACAAAGRAAAEIRFSTGRMLDAYESLFARQDDRRRPRRSSLAGWAAETAREVLGDGLDPRWLGRRVREIVGHPR